MSALRHDLARYFVLNGPCRTGRIKTVLLTQGIWAICVYRFGAWVRTCGLPRLLRKPLSLVATALQKWIEIACGISIPFSASIGRGLYIGHFGGIFVHKDAVIGENCNLSQGVTIGLAGRGGDMGVPVMGDRVYVGPHAVVAGKIRIGNDVAIGANALVTQSVPDRAVVGGVPARIISMEGSGDFVIVGQCNAGGEAT